MLPTGQERGYVTSPPLTPPKGRGNSYFLIQCRNPSHFKLESNISHFSLKSKQRGKLPNPETFTLDRHVLIMMSRKEKKKMIHEMTRNFTKMIFV
jgi:hypothetical protein